MKNISLTCFCLLLLTISFGRNNNNKDVHSLLYTLAPPVNDDPCNALNLSVGATCSYSRFNNIDATSSSVPDPAIANYAGGDVWFSIIVPANGFFIIDTKSVSGSNVDGGLAVYTGPDCNTLSLVARDDKSGAGNMPALSCGGFVPGSKVWIRFWDEDNDDFGDFDICVYSPSPIPATPTNDNPCSATALTVPFNCLATTGDNTNATASDIPVPDCGDYNSGDVWYTITVPNNGYVDFNTLEISGSNLSNGAMAIYRGSCHALTMIACDDDDGTGNMPHLSSLNLTPGETIWIRFWEEGNNDFGTFQICATTQNIVPPASCASSAPAGDNCLNATPICDLNGYCGSTSPSYLADAPNWPELDNAFSTGGSCLDAPVNNDSYLKFVAAATSADFNIWVTSSTGGDGIQMLFFEATGCSGPVICHGGWDNLAPSLQPHLVTASSLIPGNTYYLVIDGVHGDNCNYVIEAVNGLSTLNVSGNTTICAGASVSLNAGGIVSSGVTYTWTWNDASGTPQSYIGSTLSISPGATTVFTVTASAVGICPQTKTVTVNVNSGTLSAGNLSGTQQICSNSTTTFVSDVPGGSWTSGDATIATIDANTGVITPTGVAGTAIITYTIAGSSSCPSASITRNVTITLPPNAGSISGATAICSNSNTTLSTTGSGGSWASSNTAVANINASGTITPITAGATTITYSVAGTGGCSNATAISTINISSPPNAGTISGTTAICLNTVSNLATTGIGGSWSSNNNSVVTIDANGQIAAIAIGTSTIIYTVLGSGGCSNASDNATVTVSAPPVAGNLSGNQSICSNASTTFISDISGGSWSSSNTSVATINSVSGAINVLSAGTSLMTYTVQGSNGCSDATATRTLTVNAALNSGSISGVQQICLNGTTGFAATVTGGQWSSDNSGVATIDASGNITGISAGNAIISYEVTDPSGICPTASTSLPIAVVLKPQITSINNNSPICLGDNAIFYLTGTPGSQLTYSINNGIEYTRPLIGGNLTLSVSSATVDQQLTMIHLNYGACTNSLSNQSVVTIDHCDNTNYYIPNSFIPSNQVNNEVAVFKVYGNSIKSATMKIFNQWGQLIFESDDATRKGWNGKFKGVNQPAGVYTYAVRITFYDKAIVNKSGSINLIR